MLISTLLPPSAFKDQRGDSHSLVVVLQIDFSGYTEWTPHTFSSTTTVMVRFRHFSPLSIFTPQSI
jgi:hypothetical protein